MRLTSLCVVSLSLAALTGCVAVTQDADTTTTDTLGAATPSAPPADSLPAVSSVFQAVGQEPGWLLTIGDSLTLRWDYDARRLTVPAPAVQTSGSERRYEFVHQDTTYRVVVIDSLCADAMSGHRYPSTVRVSIGARTLDGCGGEPGRLLQEGEWVAQTLEARPIVGSADIVMRFGTDGRVTGSAGCNTFSARYRFSNRELTLSEAVSTRKGCAPEINEQETRFLSLISSPMQFFIEQDMLHLMRDNTEFLTARRR